MSDKEDYLTTYRVFFENFAATVNPEDQLPVNIAGYTITESELPGEVLYWTTQYLSEKQCPSALLTPLLRIILEEVRVASKKQPVEFGYKAEDSVYIALRLMQAVTARVNDVCLRYLDNSRLDSLPPPPPLHLQELKTVSAATKNSRRVMEDRHVEIGNLEALFGIESSKPTSFYAVYDGHAGSAAATYCAAHLHQYLVESPHFSTDLRKALRDAFLRTDNEFVRKSNQERACGGSTAVAVAVRGRQLHAAWAGDSLALLAKRMRLMQLVRPHKPSRQDEKDRIQAGGGAVMFWGTWRVNGQLAVSRAIGDAMYKPYVTARPELATVDLDGDEDFVVVACDGLWDFVTEDEVALAVYRQLTADPDDLKAVTKRLILQAKRQGSCDNISIIVVFLKDPHDIAADNRPPMDLGLDNALVNASLPPFAAEVADACKNQMEAAAAECEPEGELADNGVDNSDSDSEDLGPETAVDADDLDAEARNHVSAPTPPAHTVEASHIDGALADNVGESGEESEDEWNYFKGEGERSEQQPSEDPDDQDEPPRSETPCQDNSAWESSSVDMNSSPLNPDAPVFVPGTVAGSDILLAESPRKPQPMDDIELPDVAQFATEAVRRPAELLDLDNCDQLNGHHNVSFDGTTEQLNGNEKCTMDSLGFGFSVGVEPDKAKDINLIQDFERIQKDTTDFCNIQVFQAHTETNPFASDDNEELLERLKNKERDPMSMSFYQEKDDDTCERLLDGSVDLNAVQPLPPSDDDEPGTNVNGHRDHDKENISPGPEPDNDIMRLDSPERDDRFDPGTNFMEYVNNSNNLQNFPDMDLAADRPPRDDVAQTDTPESHKLLFEQIPEIPDGKSSELGFNYEDNRDPSDRAVTPQEDSQDVDMECKPDTPCESASRPESALRETPHKASDIDDEHAPFEELARPTENTESRLNDLDYPSEPERIPTSPSPAPTPELRADDAVTPEPAREAQESVQAQIHNFDRVEDDFAASHKQETVEIETSADLLGDLGAHESEPVASPIPCETAEDLAPKEDFEMQRESLIAAESPAPTQVPLLAVSPVPTEDLAPAASPLVAASPVPEVSASPLPLVDETVAPAESPLPAESPVPVEAAVEVEPAAPFEAPAAEEPELRPETASPIAAAPSPAPPAADRLTPEVPAEPARVPTPDAASGPAPDIVPEERDQTHRDLVTDVDIGIPESHAQEICVPVTSEIVDETVRPAAGTPPPTPAVDLAQPDLPAPAEPAAAPLAAVAGAVAVGAAAASVAAAKAKAPAKKTAAAPAPRAPPAAGKPSPRPAPGSATKRPAAPVAARTSLAKSPATAAKKPAAPTPAAAAPRPSPRPAAKSAPVKEPSSSTARTVSAARAAPKPAVPKAPATRPSTAAAPKPATSLARAAPAPRPATAPSARAARPPAAAARAAPRAPPSAPKPADKKPLTNGDAKVPPPIRRLPLAARPAPRPAPAAAPATAPATKPSAPRPAARTTTSTPAPRAALDKQSKDQANKRITAKAAPPRTAPAKTAPASKTSAIKSVPKKPLLPSAPLTNGGGSAAPVSKPPPSPPPADNALLPDVIA